MSIRSVGVVARAGLTHDSPVFDRFQTFLRQRGLDVHYEPELSRELGSHGGTFTPPEEAPIDLLVALGGDGTLLRGARLVAGRDVPVVGVNVGHLGFLTSIPGAELEHGLGRVLAGDFEIESRRTLEAVILGPDGEEGHRSIALNDFVVHKAGVARVTRLDLWIGPRGARHEIGSFSGDGVIIATPTGSTAYSLSAGGPIVVPDLDCTVVTPICPHTLALRPIVVSAEAEISVRALERGEPLVLTVDGQEGLKLSTDETVVVGSGPVRIPLVRFPEQSFFTTLRRKLSWAARPTG